MESCQLLSFIFCNVSLFLGFARAGGDVGENRLAATSACLLTKRMINTIARVVTS